VRVRREQRCSESVAPYDLSHVFLPSGKIPALSDSALVLHARVLLLEAIAMTTNPAAHS
jgi:hypothetical protein